MPEHHSTIAVITPTISRRSLREAVDSVTPQLLPGDEHFVVGDGPQQLARYIAASVGATYFELAGSEYGNAQRNAAVKRSTADYYVWLDDDDKLAPHALDAIRRHGNGYPLMFRMECVVHDKPAVMWTSKVVKLGGVGGSMFVVPSLNFVPWPEGQISDASLSDFDWIVESLNRWPRDVLTWCEEIIYIASRRGYGRQNP